MTIEVIGEAGINHNGDLQTAFKLADAAKESGCDCFKTQLFNTERVYPRERWAEMKMLELDRDDIVTLKNHCDNIGIEFMATPDEIDDAKFLKEIGVKRIKTSSQDITDIPFLIAIAKLDLPIIVSTGACSQDELNRSIAALTDCRWRDRGIKTTILHCVSAYPAPVEEMNLSVITWLHKTTHFNIGLSDHTTGITCAFVALGLGATMFEKHLTMDCDQAGPDHSASFEPFQMRLYVEQLREGAAAMGDGIKKIMPCEIDNRKQYQQFITRRTRTGVYK
jgi:N,N'-diacetyllegionaminate synthase